MLTADDLGTGIGVLTTQAEEHSYNQQIAVVEDTAVETLVNFGLLGALADADDRFVLLCPLD